MKTGTIISVKDQILEIEFLDEKPTVQNVLRLEGDPQSMIIVHTSASDSTFYCIALRVSGRLQRGMKVVDSGSSLSVPVGTELLGRVMNVFGEPLDEAVPIKTSEQRPIIAPRSSFTQVVTPTKVLETGIKIVDFFTPIFRGSRVGLFGGAGVGKTILLTEIIHNVVIRHKEESLVS